MKKVQVGLVGLGIGQKHLESLSQVPNAQIAAIADVDESRLGKAVARYGGQGYRDWQTMLDNEGQLDAVILATPARVRREPIAAIAERKLALFCEKPPAVDLQEALTIRSLIQESGILNTVGFMYRWAPLADRVRELLADRHLLFVRGVVAWPVFSWFLGPDAPKTIYSKRACGGPLIEQAIHFQDVLRYVTGDEPLRVQGFAELGTLYSQEGRDCEETTAYVLRHQSGMLSTHVHNWSHRGSLLQLQFVGEDFDFTWDMRNDNMSLTGNVAGQSVQEADNSTGYLQEIEGFVTAVAQSDQSLLRSPYADACRSMAVCEAATAAVEQGTNVVVAAF